MREYQFFVYILTNIGHSVVYIGVTNNLHRRLLEHHMGVADGFTKKYRCTKLIFFEMTHDVYVAIEREKQLKRWSRKKKEWLIGLENPDWLDLSYRLG